MRGAARVGSPAAFAEKTTTGRVNVEDPDDAASVVDNGQLTNMAGQHKLGSRSNAGVPVDDSRFGLHNLPDTNLVDVLAVGYNVGNVGVSKDPGDSTSTCR